MPIHWLDNMEKPKTDPRLVRLADLMVENYYKSTKHYKQKKMTAKQDFIVGFISVLIVLIVLLYLL